MVPEARDWREETTAYLQANYPPTIAEKFGNIVTVNVLPLDWARNPLHLKELNILRAQLAVLTDLIGTGIAT